MKCPKCKCKMTKINLRFTTYIGPFKYVYHCFTCEPIKNIKPEEVH